MVQVFHGCSTKTAAVRGVLHHNQENLRTLAARYGINQKTVAKWKKRTSTPAHPYTAAGNGMISPACLM
jgi:hypothetical protein